MARNVSKIVAKNASHIAGKSTFRALVQFVVWRSPSDEKVNLKKKIKYAVRSVFWLKRSNPKLPEIYKNKDHFLSFRTSHIGLHIALSIAVDVLT